MKGPPSRPQFPIISINLTDLDVIQKVSQLLGVGYCPVVKRKPHWKQSYILRFHGRKAVELMLKMRPFMSKRRQEQIDVAVDSYEKRPIRGSSKLTIEQVREIKRLIIENQSFRIIAKKVHCSVWSVNRIKNHGAFPDVVI